MRKLKGAILSQNHRRQGGGPGVKKAILIPFLQTFFQTKHFFQKLSKTIFSFFKTIFFQNKYFFQSLQKSPSGWGLCPQTPIATGGWGLRPQTPLCDMFEYTSFLNTSPKLGIFGF